MERLSVTQRERDLVSELRALSEQRAAVLEQSTQKLQSVEAEAGAARRSAVAEATETYERLLSKASAIHDAAVAQARENYESERTALRSAHTEAKTLLARRTKGGLEKAEQDQQAANWLADSVQESALRKIAVERDQRLKTLGEAARRVEATVATARDAFARSKVPPPTSDLPQQAAAPETSIETAAAQAVLSEEELGARIAAAERARERVRSAGMIKLAHWGLLGPVAVAAAGGLAAGSYLWYMPGKAGAAGGLAAAALAVFLLARILLRRWGRAQMRRRWSALMECAFPLAGELRRAQSQASAQYRLELAEIEQRHRTELTVNNREAAEKSQKLKADFQAQAQKFDAKLSEELARIDQRQTEHLTRLKQRYDAKATALEESHREQVRRADEAYDAAVGRARREVAADMRRQAERWNEALPRLEGTIEDLDKLDSRLGLSWTDDSWITWQPPTAGMGAARFGRIGLRLGTGAKTEAGDAAFMRPERDAVELPCVLGGGGKWSLLVEADKSGRERAVRLLRGAMYRLLTSLPPGRVKLTIIDPVGLGQNFAGFMHLGDHAGAVIADKIWTEPRHIEQRLADLTEHMERVIQKYLRNDFATIDDYNRVAAEVAEPYRFLVYADFPTHLSEAAARRLESIASTGARCGVHVLIHADPTDELPKGIELDDLRRICQSIRAGDDALVWRDEPFSACPFEPEHPPPESLGRELLRRVGVQAVSASRVEVPFDRVAPSDENRWTASSASGVRAPIGRAGASRLQYLDLGRGTAQHMLIAGKTGSGKSTLFHVLITSVALWYSPGEVEMYLVDFKKGVEFKTYATHTLPHARVVAIETDREFGLSVLRRLDEELRRRGDLFRAQGVADLPSYRGASGRTEPRILLMIDEFQELFVEDDRIAQEASLLLDRLVRQGRAFGVHAILGTQTLGGGYTLSRSTLGQFAVRIALQCNESDSYLILGEDNPAARMLARPGEAIYNDAGGQIEANSPFQIVWLSALEQEEQLARVAESARRAGGVPHRPVVFEGNEPADLRDNGPLARAWGAPASPTAAVRLWLGEPVAIKAPTAAVMSRQSGSNVLILGQQEEAALALIASSAISIAAQCEAGRSVPSVCLIDGSPPDLPHHDYLPLLAESLPGWVRLAHRPAADELVAEIAAEIGRRAGSMESDPLFLLIYGLHWVRSLKRPEDDFSFSMNGDEEAPPSPGKLLETIIREGPPVGVHAVIWCDTVTNLDRFVSPSVLREFSSRVLFQMGATDSSQLMDSPAANTLGLHRALLYTEASGHAETFRPYALPARHWLGRIGAPAASSPGG